tara:strand:- start:5816 stop:6124 length:309 start_codon:yes stop_codon:yes gene_type:complete
MSWDQKNGKQKYYYRNKRVDGKPVKEYFGCGQKAAEAELRDQERRMKKQRDEQHWESRLFQVEQATCHTTELASFVTLVHSALLITSGYYLHKGHEWRKRTA